MGWGNVFGAAGGAMGGVGGYYQGKAIGGAADGKNPLSFLNGDGAPKPVGLQKFEPGMATSDLKLPDAPNLDPFELGTKYQAKDVSGPLEEFKQARIDAMSQNSTAKSEAQSALERKFASMGNLNSGSYIKQANLLNQNYDQQGSKAQNELTAQESAARRGLQAQEDAKVFQSGEAYNQRAFGASGQARQEKIALQQAAFDNSTKLRSLDLALYAARQQSIDSQYNSELSSYQAEHSGGLLGSGGFLGSGFKL